VRAVVFDAVGRVAVEQVPEPRLGEEDEAILRVTRSAICGSDLHFYRGKAPLEPGDIVGHEAVGVVEAVGSQVARFAPGDRVVVSFDLACGDCWFCRHGQTQLCEGSRVFGAGAFGGGVAGTQAEYVAVPAADVNLLRVPDEVSDDAALFVGDVLTTGFTAASLGDAGAGDVVAVLGAGPVGLCVAASARLLGAGRVLVLDREPARLELAGRMGMEIVDIRERDPQMAAAAMTDDRGADVVIEAVGDPEAYRSAIDVVRRGGTIVVAGMYTGEAVEVQLGVYWARALRIVFTGLCPVHERWERVMQDVAAGRLNPLPLISHRLALDDAAEGYRLFDAREATKVVLVP